MKRKLNVKKLIITFIVIVAVIFGSVKAVKEYVYSGSIEGKLSIKKYSQKEITEIKETLNDKEINKVIQMNRDENLTKFIKEKYFIFDNLEEYLAYKNKNNKVSVSKVISLVNTYAYKDWYDVKKETNIAKKEKMLVNKFYSLKEDFVPDDIVKISSRYAYDNVYASESIVESFEELCNAAKESGYTLVASFGYRSYGDQLDTYNSYKSYNGAREADKIVAHAGNSEHQTGLAIEIEPYDKKVEEPESNDEYKWLLKNAYKYGFILRYPIDKEDITGFSYEPWHYRYVGTEVSLKMKRENITFDEYYAYYIEGK